MTVYLVGAGPGDPDLLTVRAAQLIREAQVVLYDRLVDEAILDLIPEGAQKIYVGRAVGDDTSHQDSTNDLMVRYGRQYDVVVRLKGGDPTIFGRGGEEARFLKSQDITYQIIPGITSGLGSATYSGIPLTYRGYSSSVAFVTGHEDPSKEGESVRWERLAGAADTIVIMMGVTRIRVICKGLMRGGMDPETPVVVVREGTTPRQQVLSGRVRDIADVIRKSGLHPPANIIIGRVAGLAPELAWR